MEKATLIILLIYASVILFFAFRGAKKTKDISDYALGNIIFSPISVGLALAASMTSAATFIINPGLIGYFGISGVISYAVALPLAAVTSLVILTKGFRKHGSNVKALTMAQWMGTRYQSKSYGFFFALLSLLLITFIVLICVGLTKVIAKSAGIDELYVLIGIVAFIFGYMMFGGANSMVYTNTIQAVLMLIVAFILLGSGYEHFSSGIKGFIDKLSNIDQNLTTFTNKNSFLFRDFFEIIIAQIIVGVAIVCQPHIITKSLLLKKEEDINKYLITGVIVELIFFSVVITGLFARINFPDLTFMGETIKVDGLISAYVVSEFPVFIGLIVIVGLISAGISTLEGLIQSLSTTITQDIINPLLGNKLTGKESVNINRIVIGILGVVAIFLSYDQIVNPNLSVAIFAQNGVYAYFAAAFLPILFGMFVADTPRIAVFAGSITAIMVHFTFYYGKLNFPFSSADGQNPGVAASAAIISSLLVSGLFFFIFRRNKNV